jgi:hypothetical protein
VNEEALAHWGLSRQKKKKNEKEYDTRNASLLLMSGFRYKTVNCKVIKDGFYYSRHF